jgi:hypothetical protein
MEACVATCLLTVLTASLVSCVGLLGRTDLREPMSDDECHYGHCNQGYHRESNSRNKVIALAFQLLKVFLGFLILS